MRIQRLYVDGLRNLQELELRPHPRFNVIAGANGQGKTNLLEAIWLLCALRSFRTSRLRECLTFEGERAELAARVQRQGITCDLGVELRGGRGRAFVDGRHVGRGRDYLGKLVAVLFTGDDLRLPRDEPAARRSYLDRAIWTRDRAYLGVLKRYTTALDQRNALLREGRGRSPDTVMLSVFDEQVAQAGAVVSVRRSAFVAEFDAHVRHEFAAFAAPGLSCSLAHAPRGSVDVEADEGSRAQALLADLEARRRTDTARGYTSVGPHRDDLVMRIDGRPARVHASQGQCRALVLAMKIAEMRGLEAALGAPPLLLMDDVSSELDAARNRALMAHLDALGGQVYLTTTDPRHIQVKAPRKVLTMTAGALDASAMSAADEVEDGSVLD